MDVPDAMATHSILHIYSIFVNDHERSEPAAVICSAVGAEWMSGDRAKPWSRGQQEYILVCYYRCSNTLVGSDQRKRCANIMLIIENYISNARSFDIYLICMSLSELGKPSHRNDPWRFPHKRKIMKDRGSGLLVIYRIIGSRYQQNWL